MTAQAQVTTGPPWCRVRCALARVECRCAGRNKSGYKAITTGVHLATDRKMRSSKELKSKVGLQDWELLSQAQVPVGKSTDRPVVGCAGSQGPASQGLKSKCVHVLWKLRGRIWLPSSLACGSSLASRESIVGVGRLREKAVAAKSGCVSVIRRSHTGESTDSRDGGGISPFLSSLPLSTPPL